MPAAFRLAAAPLLVAAGLVGAAAAMAADAPSVKTSPAKRGHLSSEPARGKPSAASDDPIERLRERLAEKLGNQVTNDGMGDTIRVAVTSPEGPALRARATGRAPVRKAAPRADGWSHAGATGPEHWSDLGPENALCAKGQRQSPIDIRGAIGVDLEPIAFHYQASAFSVQDTGRTVKVQVAPGNHIEAMGRRFELSHVEFRRPAEERIDGRVFDLGVHLVHQDAEGRKAVVAVLMDKGADQPVVQSVWNSLPLEKGDSLVSPHPVDLSALLPADRRYFTYMGSMTTPPCQEGVLWMVLRSPVAVSAAQLGVFSRLYPMNARPVQDLAGRLIKGPR